MSSRADLLAAVTANLQRITTAAGYRTDIGTAVTTEPAQVQDDEDAIVAVLIERQQRATDAAVIRTHRLTTVAVVAKAQAADTRQAMEMIDAIADDIERAMADRQFTYPSGIQTPQFAEMEPLVPEAGSRWVGAVIRYTTHVPIPTHPSP
ncbi:MAG: hypothetical protein ACREO4_16370 [Lysobacter sp.]